MCQQTIFSIVFWQRSELGCNIRPEERGGTVLIDSILNLLFRCRHRRLSRPITPPAKPGSSRLPAYVVCLDCGKQFQYDLERMRMGKAIKRAS